MPLCLNVLTHVPMPHVPITHVPVPIHLEVAVSTWELGLLSCCDHCSAPRGAGQEHGGYGGTWPYLNGRC